MAVPEWLRRMVTGEDEVDVDRVVGWLERGYRGGVEDRAVLEWFVALFGDGLLPGLRERWRREIGEVSGDIEGVVRGGGVPLFEAVVDEGVRWSEALVLGGVDDVVLKVWRGRAEVYEGEGWEAFRGGGEVSERVLAYLRKVGVYRRPLREGGHVLLKVKGKGYGGLLLYDPMDEQREFHGSDARVRMLMGGNASGKTTAAMADLAWRLMEGMWGVGPPVHAWVVKQRFPDDIEMDPVYQRLVFGGEGHEPFIPEWMFAGFEGSDRRVIRLRNGSSVEYRTWGQGWERLQGEAPDLIVMDEEAPTQVYQECRARLLRKPHGRMVLSFTPVVSRRWVMKLLSQSERGSGAVRAWFLDTRRNRYLSREQVELMTAGLDSEEAEVRLAGRPRQSFGRVYRMWSERNWRSVEELPEEGTDYVVIDTGIAAPTAALWIRAVPRMDGRCDLWVHREFYRKGETNVKELVKGILEVNGELRPARWLLDAWSGRQRVHNLVSHDLKLVDLWREAGLPVELTPMNRPMRRRERYQVTRAYVDLSDVSKPNLYAVRERVPHLEEELDLYCVKGLVTTKEDLSDRTREDFTGPDHLIFCMEVACVMELCVDEVVRVEHQALAARERLSQMLWDRLGDPRFQDRHLLGFRPGLCERPEV